MARTNNSLNMNKYIKKINSIEIDNLNEYLNSVSFESLNEFKLYLDDIYYNSGIDTGITDEQYDLLKDNLITRDSNYIPPIGAIVRETENRVKVPFHMGSMDKIRPHKKDEVIKFRKWLKKYNYPVLIQDKLDGVSCLIVVSNGNYKLYKRPGSDGFGADITYLLPYLKSIPQNLDNIVVRGELIMDQNIFNQKYIEEYKNSRNMVSGLTSSKKIGKGVNDIDFVVYERIIENDTKTPYEHFIKLKEMGFQVVNYELLNELINIDELCELFGKFKVQSQYGIDGIIVQSNSINARNTEGNPDYSFAFKMNIDSQIKETEVIDVEWNVSKWGLLKPRVKIQPVYIGGVVIQYATGFYGKFIRDNGIGPGSIIKITRSGDVIPFIVDIVQKTEPSMPKIPYKWNESGIDIYTDEQGEEISIKQTISFFSSLNIKFIGSSIVRKLYNSGLNSTFKILSASIEQIASIDGLGNKSAERIYTNIQTRLKSVSISELLSASGSFGFGISEKKVEKLLNDIPNLLEIDSNDELLKKIKKVEGFSTKTASNIITNLEKAKMFINEINKILPNNKTEYNNSCDLETKQIDTNLNNYKIVCTGFRDNNLEKDIMMRGGSITSSVSKNTDIVIFKNKETKSVKLIKATELGIEIIEKEEFIKKYLN